ncbi:DUF4263 domain-containing protein, partial [bacterium]|nr:DUF4263 domain-containing protein [bacterium]
ICISPIVTFPDQSDFLHRKYKQVEDIILEGFDFTTPENVEDLLDVLQELPTGFIKGYEYGLGLMKDLRFIIHTVEEIPEIKYLVVSKQGQSKIDGKMYILNYNDFELIRKGINSISYGHQKDSRIEKSIFSYNSLLHQLRPEIYTKKKKPYQKDVLRKFISGRSINSSSLTKSDAQAAIKILSDSKQRIYSKEREKILQLQQDIELINLECLIGETEKLLSQKASESKWQVFLEKNPVILSLAFGYPVVKLQESASVGGRTLSGSGDKITDFLVKNNLTNNTALVEIKRPSTKLLYQTAYRDSVYAPSKELSGGVTQILDQKYRFQKEIATIKDNSGINDIETYSVDCVIIIGTIPTEKDKQKSFELYRSNMKDVRIFTFDEMLNKLKDIYSAFSQQETTGNE